MNRRDADTLRERPLKGVRAVLFDVDGTLYAQRPVRAAMAAELAAAALRAPLETWRTTRVLATFRRLREGLRTTHGQALERLQYEACANRLGIDPLAVEQQVDEWMMRRPLKHLRRARRPGLLELLEMLRRKQILIGALSDYPVTDKLVALGVADYFSLRLCTTDRGINAFKPDPAGFVHACTVWGLRPEEILYVGDRPEVDGDGAAAAGTHCVIIGTAERHGDAGRHAPPAVVAAFGELTSAFAHAH